ALSRGPTGTGQGNDDPPARSLLPPRGEEGMARDPGRGSGGTADAVTPATRDSFVAGVAASAAPPEGKPATRNETLPNPLPRPARTGPFFSLDSLAGKGDNLHAFCRVGGRVGRHLTGVPQRWPRKLRPHRPRSSWSSPTTRLRR